jgi:hypothetical protein
MRFQDTILFLQHGLNYFARNLKIITHVDLQQTLTTSSSKSSYPTLPHLSNYGIEILQIHFSHRHEIYFDLRDSFQTDDVDRYWRP